MNSPSLAYSYSQEAVSAAVVDQLKRTRGWVLFFSVMMWIGAGFLILGGLAMIAMGVIAGISESGMGEELAKEFAAIGGITVFGVIYLVMAIFYIYPALKLGKYAARIRDLSGVPSEQNLVAALNEQRAFWKYVGMMMLVMFALYFVIAIVAVVGAVIAGAGASSM